MSQPRMSTLANFFFAAGLTHREMLVNVYDQMLTDMSGIGMVISAHWELILGDTYAYIVLSAFGFFYGGYGSIITPLFGVTASYGTDTVEYNNALGFFVLSRCRLTHGFYITDIDGLGCMEYLLPHRFSTVVSGSFMLYAKILWN